MDISTSSISLSYPGRNLFLGYLRFRRNILEYVTPVKLANNIGLPSKMEILGVHLRYFNYFMLIFVVL
jgi:hypothetical protein